MEEVHSEEMAAHVSMEALGRGEGFLKRELALAMRVRTRGKGVREREGEGNGEMGVPRALKGLLYPPFLSLTFCSWRRGRSAAAGSAWTMY